jgi:Domain of unknown function (DUF4352)
MKMKLFNLIVTLFLGLTLLLTACGSSAATPNTTATALGIIQDTRIAATEATQKANPPTATARPATPTTVATIAPTIRPNTVAPTLLPTTVAPVQTNPAKVKETVNLSGYVVTLHNVERAKQFKNFVKAKDGNTYVALELSFVSTQNKNVSVNAFSSRLIDSSAFAYTSTTARLPFLPSQNDLPAGDIMRGWWTYEVPESAKGLTLDYKAGFPEVRFRFNIEEEGTPATQPLPVKQPKLNKIGENVTSEGYLITVNAVEKAKTFGQFAKAEEGFILMAIDLTVESGKDKGVFINPFFCTIRDSEGYFYTSTIGKDPSLKSQNDLAKGEKTRGWITIAVPEKALGLYFEYRAGSPEAKVRFEIV